MIYPLVRAVAGTALRWFYGPIEVRGRERFPADGPLLVVANHPNALVDALIMGWLAPRALKITAKATIFSNPVGAMLLRGVGVLPLRRSSDEPNGNHDPHRNVDTFRAVTHALAHGGAVLIFPEGKSHDDPALAPLRSGAARMALTAAADAGVRGIRIVPVGLTFERKDLPRTRVLVEVGEPIDVDAWLATVDDASAQRVPALTREIDARLRAVTLNFGSPDDAARIVALATCFARLLAPERPLGARRAPLASRVELVRALARAAGMLAGAPAGLQERAASLVRRLRAFDEDLAANHIAAEDLEIPIGITEGAWFTLRETWLAAIAAPVALWGRINHWIPFHGARLLARRHIESAVDPAMRTIIAGAALVSCFYALQTWLVWHLLGAVAAAIYAVSLPLAADVDFALRERFGRAQRRAGAYLRFRRDPALQRALLAERTTLRREAESVAAALRVEIAVATPS